jgi:membrane-associated phospholipid phosphatase
MSLRSLALKKGNAFIDLRTSAVSRPALFLTLVLMAIGVSASIATKFVFASLPDFLPFLAGIVILDMLTRLAPQTRLVQAVQTFIYGVMYLAVTTLCGIIAAYGMQRFAFPLQDRHLMGIDRALGFDWFAYAHWVDRHAVVQTIFHVVYYTLSSQTALPLGILAFLNRPRELRIYLLAFAIAFTATIIVSALMPAAGPIAFVDRESFHILRFTGATPFHQLMLLRQAGPLVLTSAPGGIATFPSFHATVAVLTPLALRRYPRVFAVLVVLDAIMLCATLTEGAHYFIDVIAGGGMAFFAYTLAVLIMRFEDRSLRPAGRPDPAVEASA